MDSEWLTAKFSSLGLDDESIVECTLDMILSGDGKEALVDFLAGSFEVPRFNPAQCVRQKAERICHAAHCTCYQQVLPDYALGLRPRPHAPDTHRAQKASALLFLLEG